MRASLCGGRRGRGRAVRVRRAAVALARALVRRRRARPLERGRLPVLLTGLRLLLLLLRRGGLHLSVRGCGRRGGLAGRGALGGLRGPCRRAVEQVADRRGAARAARGPVLAVGAGHQRRDRRVVVVVRRQRRRVHRREPARRRRAARGLERCRGDRAPLVRELLRPRPRVRALEEAALVAELVWRVRQLTGACARLGTVRTTLPGVSEERRHVEVSVVRQL